MQVLDAPDREADRQRTIKLDKAIWAGAEHALALYGLELVFKDQLSRSNGMIDYVEKKWFLHIVDKFPAVEPWWWGIEAVHLSHLAHLIKENPHLYSERFSSIIPSWSEISLIVPLIIGGTHVLKEVYDD